MATDIKLDEGAGNQVVVESDILRSTASDFMLDAQSRRRGGGTRRALVHDGSDGLTINFNGDYPGGVTAGSSVTVNGDLAVTGRVSWGDAPVTPGLDRELDACRRRLQHLESTLEQLLPLVGYAVVPGWRTREEVENGDDMGRFTRRRSIWVWLFITASRKAYLRITRVRMCWGSTRPLGRWCPSVAQ